MENRRNCSVVISQMLDQIPPTEIELKIDLVWNYEDSLYKAPEETIQWQRTMETLERHITCPTKDWEFKVLSIFTTKTKEELELLLKSI